MKKLIVALLAMTLILTALVACDKDEDKKPAASPVTSGTQEDASSTVGLTSEEMDAWGDISLDVEPNPSSETGETDSNTDSTESKTESSASSQVSSADGSSSQATSSGATSSGAVSSYDKDQGFGPWVPIG